MIQRVPRPSLRAPPSDTACQQWPPPPINKVSAILRQGAAELLAAADLAALELHAAELRSADPQST